MGDRAEYDRADYWDRHVQQDPARAFELIVEAVRSSGLTDRQAALAWRAAARSLLDRGRIADAEIAARRALDVADRTDLDAFHSVVMSSSVVLAEAGNFSGALASLRDLESMVDGVPLGRVRLQISCVLMAAGQLSDADDRLEQAGRLLAPSGEALDRFRVVFNRGYLRLQQGRLDDADDDFAEATELARSLDMTAAVAQSYANRGVAAGRARRLRAAVDHFDRAAEVFEMCGNPARAVAGMEIDRAEVMMHSGLPLDAVTAAWSALERIEPTGNQMLVGDAQLMVATAELAAGRIRSAMISIRAAEQTFASTGRIDMVAHAAGVRASAQLLGARNAAECRRALVSAGRVAEEIRSGGWASAADGLALDRVRAGWRWGLIGDVDEDLQRLRRGTSDGRRDTALAGWFALAVSRAAANAIDEALDDCGSGLSRLDEIVAEATSLEHRSAAMQLGNDLSQLTIELAVANRDADTALAAAEGTRARALHDELAEGRRHSPLTSLGAERLRAALSAQLGDRTLVEWIVVGDEVWAVVYDSSGSRLVRACGYREAVRARDRIVVWLDRAAAEPDDSSVRSMRAARLLDDLLIAPLGLPTDTGVVVVPVDLLHGVPWSGLPTLTDRPIVLTPNAQVWLDADRIASQPIESIGVVVGPDLDRTEVERDAIESHYHGARVAAGAGATAAAVGSMLGECDLVHLAAHGTFRSDYPLLSTIRLSDGEATMYDAIPPRVNAKLVILSSCEGGAQGTADGSEVLGLSSVLLARGAAAVLAPLTQVRELECAEFVAEVHGQIAAGEALGCAVAAVRERWLADDDLSRWAVASSFTCFGSGAVSLAR